MIVRIQISEMNGLVTKLRNVSDNIPRAQAVITKAVAKKTVRLIAKQVQTELDERSITQKAIIKHVTNKRSSGTSRVVTLKKSDRIPLKHFNMSDLKKGGVAYTISKTRGRKKINDAFVLSQFGGHVFKRATKKSLPIFKPLGPSPWGVFVIRRMMMPLQKVIIEEMLKQYRRRIRYHVLRKAKAI